MSCQICGKFSAHYPLCDDCLDKKMKGEIEKCDVCKIWHFANKPCKCEKKVIKINFQKPLKECILCKSESNGCLVCKDCYNKSKDKVLNLKISKCSEIEIIDD